ncbi:MAG: efflux RND transporter periplasmic adaptor subunit [Treponema sp.]|jgi:HlyD family secretion protein|nr:efflux RND transporter periplasmic adaptor subunit [Treponema sp.]
MKMRYVIPAVFLAAGLAGAAGCSRALRRGTVPEAAYEFGVVSRGSMEKTVSASGTLKPVSTVSVLSRMNGKVDRIYVDFNDSIRKGDILAALNTDTLRLQREQQTAQVVKARAHYELQAIQYANLRQLAEKDLIAGYELKTGKTTLDIYRADLAAAEASLKVIETEINQYALITAPIDGIVLERNINEGSTVVEGSSSNSSSLFTLAENLEEMQIEAAVGELDISGIRQGQEARFTLEALPGRTYTGVVDSLHLVPAVQNNVVSYTVIINVENLDGALLPGMTCAVEFILERREDILMAPNAALRFQPRTLGAEEIAGMVFNAALQGMSADQQKAAREERNRALAREQEASARTAGPSGTGLAGLVSVNNPAMGRRGGPGPGAPAQGSPNRSAGPSRSGGRMAARNLWYLDGEGKLAVLQVRTGITDGAHTEVRPAESRAGSDGQGGSQTGSTGSIEGMRIIVREKL